MQRHPNLVPLSHQHHDVLALCVLISRSLEADQSPENVTRQAAKAVSFARTEGDNHFEMEEQILFPLIERELGGHALLGTLRREHEELRRMAAVLEEQPALGDLEAFVSLLRGHVRKEESGLFHDVQERLPEDAFRAAGEAMRKQAIQVCITG